METARLTTWSPCWSPSSRVLTSMPLAPPETISCQKLISGEMSGASFWFLPMNFAGGSVEYRPLSDAVPFSVNELFHFSVPSNAAVEPCATKGMETRRSPQAKRMRLAIEEPLRGIIEDPWSLGSNTDGRRPVQIYPECLLDV